MDAAKKLYTEFCDFDYIDYSETYNSDLLFIQELIFLFNIENTDIDNINIEIEPYNYYITE